MKTFLRGLLAGLVILIVSMIVDYLFRLAVPALQMEYENTSIFRAWSDPLMSLYFLYPFILGVLLAWIWGSVKSVISGSTLRQRAMRFGFSIWIILSIPGMLITYASFQVSLIMVVSWSIGSLLSLLAASCLLSRMHVTHVE